MPVPLPTPQLAFREMTPDDLDDMAALLGDPEVMRYYPHPKTPRRGVGLDQLEPPDLSPCSGAHAVRCCLCTSR